jgi:hypothetical protein
VVPCALTMILILLLFPVMSLLMLLLLLYVCVVCVLADMMKEVGSKSHGSTMFLPHGPDSVYQLRQLLARS